MKDERPLRIRSAPQFVLLVLTFGALWAASDLLRGRELDAVGSLVFGLWFVVLMLGLTRMKARQVRRRRRDGAPPARHRSDPAGTGGQPGGAG